MIGSLYAKLAAATGQDLESEEPTGPKGRPSKGPVKFRTITAGQQRRAARRAQATAERKATRRYVKRWLANERAVAALRGQLITVAAIPGHDGKYLVGQSPALMKNAWKQLEKTYGSVDAALEVYEGIVAERAAKR